MVRANSVIAGLLALATILHWDVSAQSLVPVPQVAPVRTFLISGLTGQAGSSLSFQVGVPVGERLNVAIGYGRFRPEGSRLDDANQLGLGIARALGSRSGMRLSAIAQGAYLRGRHTRNDEFFDERIEVTERSYRVLVGLSGGLPLRLDEGVSVSPFIEPAISYIDNVRRQEGAATGDESHESSFGVAARLGVALELQRFILAAWVGGSTWDERVSLSPLDSGDDVLGMAAAVRF